MLITGSLKLINGGGLMNKFEKSLTVDDIANTMGLAKQTVFNNYIADIKMKCRHWKFGKTLRIDSDDFGKYLDKKMSRPRN